MHGMDESINSTLQVIGENIYYCRHVPFSARVHVLSLYWLQL